MVCVRFCLTFFRLTTLIKSAQTLRMIWCSVVISRIVSIVMYRDFGVPTVTGNKLHNH